MSKQFSKYKEEFLTEARSHLETMNSNMLILEKDPENRKVFHEVFRAIHTLKSMAAAMEFANIANVCHKLEDLLDKVKNEKLGILDIVDELFASFDFLKLSLKKIEDRDIELSATKALQRLDKKNNNNNNHKIAFNLEAERVNSIEVKVERLDSLLKLVEELLVEKMKLDLIRDDLENPELTATVEVMGRTISDLQYNVMQVRIVSLLFVFKQFPRMVRDLGKSQGKEINLIIEGGEIEIDRSMIDALRESLIHIIRNAVDHGIETVTERKKSGKSEIAEIRIAAIRTKESVIIEISDDGKGLNIDEIKQRGIETGVLREGDKQEEIINSIYQGVSTSKKISNVSGRGLGLNIVKQKIESIDGTIRVTSIKNRGTQFYIEIPLTMAVIKALFVKLGERIYAVPVMNIGRLLMVDKSDLKKMMNYEAIIFGEKEIPIIHLKKLFNIKTKAEESQESKIPIVVVRRGQQQLGLVVDELLSSQEIVIKPLSRVVKENRYFSGSALIGSGEIVLILDIFHLILTQSRKKMNQEKMS